MENLAAEAGNGAVIVAGDFNSTPDMHQFRQLLTNGYRRGRADRLRAGADVSLVSVHTSSHHHRSRRDAQRLGVLVENVFSSRHRSPGTASHCPDPREKAIMLSKRLIGLLPANT
ncbi:hypothetical protein [Mycolicibacterium vanbaalenii]|uniref:hypothetical protein n=1 Tax=Mycolicibacterium vanbaalenii TaxID=110539 RepID=UPI003CC8072D